MGRRIDIAECLNAAGLAGLIAVLIVAYADQFAAHDLPCPLCLLQRVALAGVAYGLLLNLRFGPRPSAYAILLLAALFGMAAAGRQVLLHITPGSGAYGAPLLGLHLYTWSFILFVLVVLGTAVLLLVPTSVSPAASPAWTLPLRVKQTLAWAAIGLTALNAVTTFLQCGPVECPDNPVRYWAFAG
jgi:disulfide bond formation protein DsbB